LGRESICGRQKENLFYQSGLIPRPSGSETTFFLRSKLHLIPRWLCLGVVYFGTLWNEKKFVNSIIKHKNRRDKTWHLIEFFGDIKKDIDSIERLINDFDGILIDGLLTWLIKCSKLKRVLLLF
jgi:hypothetical protein